MGLRSDLLNETKDMNKQELVAKKIKVEQDVASYQLAISEEKTSHIAHLVVSVLTCGFWILPWIIASHFTAKRKQKRKKAIKKANQELVDIEVELAGV